jgi:hypothetical protein
MTNYNVTLQYQTPGRDSNGFPQFGKQVVEVLATSHQRVYNKLNELFGKDNYIIIQIDETNYKQPE